MLIAIVANLDLVSDSTFALILMAVVVVCGLLSGPVVDFIVRHREFLRIFREQEKRLR